MQYEFPENLFFTVIGGLSILDIPRLRIENRQQAHDFILTYGYNLSDEKDLAEVNRLYRKSIEFFNSELLFEVDKNVPAKLVEIQKAEDYYALLITASRKELDEDQVWACAVLRVLHVINHLRNGLFRTFSDKIQDQIFGLFYGHIHRDAESKPYLGSAKKTIALADFQIKKYKSRSSAAIKLLAKRDEFAMNILDRMGVRIITNSIYDSFRALDYLISEHIISVPNITPDQSKNTLYPLNVFFDVMDKISLQNRSHTEQEIDELLWKTLKSRSVEDLDYTFKNNDYSGGDYKAIKFIARHMININIGKKNLRFFFPYEVQIMDKATNELNSMGQSAHEEYKKRQKLAALDRAFGKKSKI